MALGDRSVDLILKAQVDRALQPLAQVVQRVKDLVAVLDAQREAAVKGDTTLGAYAKAVRDVQSASDDLLKARGAVDAFAVRQATLDTKQAAVDTKRAARDTFAASLPDASERTTQQDKALTRLNTSLATSERQASTAAIAYQKAVDQLQRMGVLTDQLAASQQRLRLDQAQATIAAGILESSTALSPALALNDRLIATLKLAGIEKQAAEQRARDTARFVADQEREKQAVLDAAEAIRAKGRAAQQAINTASFTDQLRSGRGISRADIEAAFADADKTAKIQAEIVTAVRATEAEQARALRGANELWAAEAAGAEKARIATEKFRVAVVAANESIAKADQQLASSASRSAPVSTLQAVASASGPARGATDVADTSAALDRLEATLAKGRQTAQSFNRTLDELFQVQRQLASDASLIDAFKAQQAATLRAEVEFISAREALLKLSQATEVTSRSISDLRRAETTLETTTNNYQRQLQQSTAIDASLKARRIDTANLTAETAKLVSEAQRLNTVQQGLQANSGKVGGLSSFQLQNLQFQVNDVVTQLSLGQGVLRTFESQAGQIFQIFDLTGAAMLRFAAIAGPVALVVGVVVAALLRMKEATDSTRAFSAQLTVSADGLAYQAKALTNVSRVIEGYGVSFGDAREAVKQFVRDGLSTASMEQFAKTAYNLSVVTGQTFAEALKSLSVIATGSLSDIMKLDEGLNILTATQAADIRQAFDSGEATRGRTIAINAFTVALQRGRDEGITPTAIAYRDLTLAWHGFLDELGRTSALNTAITALANMARLATEVTSALRVIFNPTQAEAESKVKLLSEALDKLQLRIDALKKSGDVSSGEDSLSMLQAKAKDLTRLLQEAVAERDKLVAAGTAGSGSLTSTVLPSAFSSLPPADSRATKTIPGDIQAVISAVSSITKVSEAELSALYRLEASRKADGTFATSSAGAVGAFQLMPETFATVVKQFQGLFDALSKTIGKPTDINTPEFNALAGALYFQQQKSSFGGNAALGAAAYNMGPGSAADGTGLRGVLEGQKQLPKETAQYVATFLAAMGGAPATALPGVVVNPNIQNDIAKKNQAVLYEQQQRQLSDVNTLLRGQERIDRDAKLVDEFARKLNEDTTNSLKGALPSPEVTSGVAAEIARFAKKLNDQREKEIRDANNAATQILKTAQDQVDKADKTNPEAQRAVVNRDFDARLSQINVQIANGATGVALDSMNAARDAINKARATALEQATIGADRAIVDTVVKTRDEQVAAVSAEMSKGAISIADGFARMRAIVQQFSPLIQRAIAVSNSDLARQVQTPAIQEQQARNAKVNVNDEAVFKAGDAISLSKINDLVSARNDKVKTYNDLVSQGALTQREADAQSIKAYNDARPKIAALTDALRTDIDLQLKNGEITPETYAKIRSEIEKTTAASNDLTASQKKMASEINNVIENSAVAAFDSITTGIGAAIAGTESWGDALKNVGTAFAQMAASILKGIAEIIIKQEILNALQEGSKAGGGVGNFISALFGGGGGAAGAVAGTAVESAAASSAAQTAFADALILAHTGGVVGSLTTSRQVNPAVFFNAVRAHSGGMVGLSRGEVPMILQQGEEVLTSKDPRHRNNFAGNAPTDTTPTSLRNVILFDDSQVAGAMAGAHGEKVLFSFLKRNAPAVRQLVGGK